MFTGPVVQWQGALPCVIIEALFDVTGFTQSSKEKGGRVRFAVGDMSERRCLWTRCLCGLLYVWIKP